MIHGSACTKMQHETLQVCLGSVYDLVDEERGVYSNPYRRVIGCFLMYLLGTGHKTCYMQVHWCCMQIPTILVTVNFKSATQKIPRPQKKRGC